MTLLKPTPIILAIETATDACSVAISKNQQIFSRFVVQPQAHAKLLLGMLDEVCLEAGISLLEVDLFAYGMGPGSFTGLRIAASAIQGLAFASNKPVMGISSLQTLAQQLPSTSATVLPIIDARMQEVYWGQYKFAEDGMTVAQQEDNLAAPSALELSSATDYLAVGTGAIAYADQLLAQIPSLRIVKEIIYPRATEVAQVAAARYRQGDFGMPAAQALPAYIRNNVAQVGKKNPD